MRGTRGGGRGRKTEVRGRRAEGGGTGDGRRLLRSGRSTEVTIIESRPGRSAARNRLPESAKGRPVARRTGAIPHAVTHAGGRCGQKIEGGGQRAEVRGRRAEGGSRRSGSRERSALSGRSIEVTIIESRPGRSAARNRLPESAKGPAGSASDRPECKAPNGGAGLVSAPPSATQQAGRDPARSGRPVARRTVAIPHAVPFARGRCGQKTEGGGQRAEVGGRRAEGRETGEGSFVRAGPPK